MYTFEDKLNGESLTLRPEATSGIVRATMQHNLTYDRPQRVWTSGPMFRHERPQKGRYRQFHQIDVEALGFAGPDVDAEQIVMLARLWKALGLPGIELQINSIGDASERAAHREAADRVLRAPCRRSRRRRQAPAARQSAAHPRQQEPRDAGDDRGRAEARRIHRRRIARALRVGLQMMLGDAGLAYVVNPRLVRGLDYYNRTVFEWVATSGELGAQGHGRRRRALRLSVRDPGRQEELRVRVRDRHRAHDRAPRSGGRAIAVGAARVRRARRRGCRDARAQRRRTLARRRHEHRRQRGRRQHEVADEARRRERRALRAHHRTRRSKHRTRSR